MALKAAGEQPINNAEVCSDSHCLRLRSIKRPDRRGCGSTAVRVSVSLLTRHKKTALACVMFVVCKISVHLHSECADTLTPSDRSITRTDWSTSAGIFRMNHFDRVLHRKSASFHCRTGKSADYFFCLLWSNTIILMEKINSRLISGIKLSAASKLWKGLCMWKQCETVYPHSSTHGCPVWAHLTILKDPSKYSRIQIRISWKFIHTNLSYPANKQTNQSHGGKQTNSTTPKFPVSLKIL